MNTPIKLADTAAAGAAALVGATWLADMNAYLQLVATVVAILAGIAAAYYHVLKSRYLREDHNDDIKESNRVSEEARGFQGEDVS